MHSKPLRPCERMTDERKTARELVVYAEHTPYKHKVMRKNTRGKEFEETFDYWMKAERYAKEQNGFDILRNIYEGYAQTYFYWAGDKKIKDKAKVASKYIKARDTIQELLEQELSQEYDNLHITINTINEAIETLTTSRADIMKNATEHVETKLKEHYSKTRTMFIMKTFRNLLELDPTPIRH